MTDRSLPSDLKRTSVLRRVPELGQTRLKQDRGREGDVCAFQLSSEASTIAVEASSGRAMTIAPGNVFLATTGHRESTRWVSGVIPHGGLVPGRDYWVLAECGVVGELLGEPPEEPGHFGRVRYLGVVCTSRGRTLNIRQFAFKGSAQPSRKPRRTIPVYLVLGTSGDSGKTTAGLSIVRTLRTKGRATVTVLKATGTPSMAEIASYQDFGATYVFDCIDFGLPTTYPSGRQGIGDTFANALDGCLSLPAEALVVECGGDLFGANVPEFLACLRSRSPDLKVVLAAADALGALGSKHALAEVGLQIDLITGPCTDTPALRQRTEALCRVPAMNLLRGGD